MSSVLLADWSLGMSGNDIPELAQARAVIPKDSRIHVGFRDSDDSTMRLRAARAARQSGLAPVPIIAARRLRSEAMLREFLSELQRIGASASVLIVAGDPAQPLGPYADSASVIESGLLEEYGVREVGVAAHPAGHPVVAADVLWSALKSKATALAQRGLSGNVVTQFDFDAELVLAWLVEVRKRGVGLPVRIGVPGPASVRRLLSYAARCGVNVSARAARDYGFSLAEPMDTVGPDRFVRTLVTGYDPRLHGEVRLHVNNFSGLVSTAQWISQFRRHNST